jgi:hypothetical protein
MGFRIAGAYVSERYKIPEMPFTDWTFKISQIIWLIKKLKSQGERLF